MSANEVTGLLGEWRRGNREALERLIPIVYAELREIADRYLRRERGGHTLQPTALVHEAWIRLADQNAPFQNRAHFFGVAAEIMRRLLVDHARRKQAEKRGGAAETIRLEDGMDFPESRDLDLVALDDALRALAQFDERQSRIVELRFFAGLDIDETAEALGISPATVKREWRVARAWLLRELAGS